MGPLSGLISFLKSLQPGRKKDGEGSFLREIDREKLPAHVAFIMDGNGRWAEKRGLPRAAGHRAGTETIRMVIKEVAGLGIKYITLYAFSLENWSRPREEVSALMGLFVEALEKELEELHRSKVVIKVSGRIDELPEKVRDSFRAAIERTKDNEGLVMVLALNYSGRAEIVDAARKAAELSLTDLDEDGFRQLLYLPEVPDPELVIRTSGEFRISNFLLWQAAYSEIYVTDVLWPDFSKDDLIYALSDFQRRKRRFGGI